MNSLTETTIARADTGGSTGVLGHPDDVVRDPGMTIAEKRALLAQWASDLHAVENAPALRQLDDGSVVPVSDILRALKSLGRPVDCAPDVRRTARRPRGAFLSRVRIMRHRDDDDDPPPCPASAAIPVQWRRTEAIAAA